MNSSLNKLLEAVEKYGIKQAAELLGIKEESVKRQLRNARRSGKWNGSTCDRDIDREPSRQERNSSRVEFKQNQNGASVSGQAYSLEDLLEKANVDTDKWRVKTWKIKDNSWDVTMRDRDIDLKYENGKATGTKIESGALTHTNRQYFIEATLEPNTDPTSTRKFKKELIEEIKSYSPKVALKSWEQGATGNLLEVNIPDLHLGKMSWSEETGFKNYNVKIAIKRFEDALDYMLAKALKAERIDRVIFIVGNDLFNSDNAYPFTQTTAGTPQQDDTRWQKIFREGRQLMVRTILKLAEIAPVDVLVVPGNHDQQKSFYLGDVLEAYFHHNPNININNSPRTRKYYQWGKCLLGFAHGGRKDEGIPRLINNMKHECAQEWGQTMYREWHCGDIHHYKEIKQRGSSTDIDLYAEDIDGVMVKWLRTLMFNDEWEAKKGFISQKGAHMFIWNKEDGNTHEIKYNRYE